MSPDTVPGMCRSCTEGGRRCRRTATTRATEREASKRYYARAKARKKIAALRAQGIPAMDDLDCPITYHLGNELDLTRPVPETNAGAKKPPGLWTSPGRIADDGTVQTGWMDWHITDGARDDIAQGRALFAVEPQPGAVIIRLDDAESVKAFGRAFPQFAQNRNRDYEQQEAWAEVRATGIDGLMLTNAGLIGSRHVQREHDDQSLRIKSSRQDYDDLTPAERVAAEEDGFADSLSLWDVSSVVWFNNAVIRSDHTVEPGPYQKTDIPEGEDPYDYDPYRLPADKSLDEGSRTIKEPRGAAVARDSASGMQRSA